MNKWNYGDAYKKYDMSGIINIGTGIVKVHNIFDTLPDFMKRADVIFCDPPCSLNNINTFYTKADRTDYQTDYTPFEKRLFECIDEINPQLLYLEVFKSNKDSFIEECKKRYSQIKIYDSCYYHNKKNKCWIIQCSHVAVPEPDIFLDEEDFIKWICKNIDYKCIGDLCMGRGLVGYNSFINNKPFVGTELNKKRLAVLIDRIKKSEIMKN